MLPIHFAPLQGHTDAIYRRLHHTVAGGVTCYYTPFIRWEHGGCRNKDLREVTPHNNDGTPVVPQVIASSRDEMMALCDMLLNLGWRRIDLNMGCPFPMQVHAGRGCGLLAHTATVASVLGVTQERPEIQLSVKMRLGWVNADEGLRLLPLLNELPLVHIALHPRLGVQQYKGAVDLEAFDTFLRHCRHPLLYNGDLTTYEQMVQIEQRYPSVAGLMIGRGLLSNPLLARHYLEGRPTSAAERWQAMEQIHDRLMHHATQQLQGDTQILSRLQPFWEYAKDDMPKKLYKQLTRCGSMRSYREACVAFHRMVASAGVDEASM